MASVSHHISQSSVGYHRPFCVTQDYECAQPSKSLVVSLQAFCFYGTRIYSNLALNTVEPRINEVARDWGNWFVKLRVCYVQNLDLTSLQKNNQLLYRGLVNYYFKFFMMMMIIIIITINIFFCGVTSRYPAFWNKNDYCK